MNFLRPISDNDDSDDWLVKAYRDGGDMQVLARLYQRYMDLVYGVCLKYLKDPEASKDAVMQVFEILVVKLRSHSVDNFRGWLHVLARNHCLMQLRSAKNMKTTDIDPALMQSDENLHQNGVMEKEEHLEQLEDCLETLPAGQQQAIRLFYLEQKCYQEIADQTAQPWNAVRSLIQNGRRNLKNCMERKQQESTGEKRTY
jgi:RNA polymerase sigma-70 factor (ECF subfamily)